MHRSIIGLLLVVSFLVSPMSAALAQNGTIKVGENVQVSAANNKLEHQQPVVDADPDDPKHLIACSHIFAPEPEPFASAVAYISFDGGQTWQQSLRAEGIHPVCAFGHHGLAYIAILGRSACLPSACTYSTVDFYRSTDGGRTWTKSPGYYHAGDHPYLTVDNISNTNRNAVYVSTMLGAEPYDADRDWASQVSGFALYRSDDEGKSFSAPVSAYSSHGHWMQVLGGTTVMADGTYVVAFPELMKSPFAHDPKAETAGKNAWIKVAISRNGGKTLEHTSTVATVGFGRDPAIAAALKLGVAADTTSGPFRNRLYVAWDERQLRRHRIWLSHSDDMGKTWSEPVAVDDDSPNPSPLEGPNNFLPEIAVNEEGVVGLIWYDRRDNPDGLGWYARFTASLDGGETFLPSVRLSTAPMSFVAWHHTTFEMMFSKSVYDAPTGVVGYSIGLTASKGSAFHALWTDNRTGVPQLWTAQITVSGKVLRNGSDELSGLADVSAKAPIHIGNSYWDWSTGAFECDVFIKNVSAEPINGPVKLRLLRVDSRVGTVREVKIGERPVEAGSVVDIPDEALKPGKWSKPVHVSARINVLFGPHDQDIQERLQQIFAMDLKVFAPAATAKK